jgi:hypothetical protein
MSKKILFCTLPGQPAVRLSTTEGGHVCIVGETPREIPEIFHSEALAKGCFTEEMLAGIKGRLGGNQKLEKEEGDDLTDEERLAKIKTATITILNAGDPTLLTGGKPKVDKLAEVCGFEVTGAERDQAFEATKA